MEPHQQTTVAAAMKRLWVQFLPQLEERVRVLESAAAAVAEGSLTAEQREQASSAAHKLAGVLGTFGLNEGTELAREAESFYSSGLEADRDACQRLAQIPLQLQSMFAARE
ncbi:MAG TPA: Hpt domain-containing protein [Terracidiphilus sp.]|jgi:HPt (histidine-containing phosphotransfer) domain-containing protein|nr:Hpt domain-containing protein [Terracidiphilus sp.]